MFLHLSQLKRKMLSTVVNRVAVFTMSNRQVKAQQHFASYEDSVFVVVIFSSSEIITRTDVVADVSRR